VRITSLQGPHGAYAAVVTPHGPVPIRRIADVSGDAWPATVQGLLQAEKLTALQAWLDANASLLPSLVDDASHRAAPLLHHPPKILGVGLNYAEHAGDLGETRPDEPATFMKPYTSLIAAGETIPIPRQSERTTGEAELGLVIGAHGKDVAEEDAASLTSCLVPTSSPSMNFPPGRRNALTWPTSRSPRSTTERPLAATWWRTCCIRPQNSSPSSAPSCRSNPGT